jgi:hypothetical protein
VDQLIAFGGQIAALEARDRHPAETEQQRSPRTVVMDAAHPQCLL